MRKSVSSPLALASLLVTSTALAQAQPAARPAAGKIDPLAVPEAGTTLSPELEQKLKSSLGGTPGGLTAEEAGKRAAATSPGVRDKEKQIESAEARMDTTRAQFYPRLVGTARATYLSPITLPSLANFGGGTLVGSPNGEAGVVQPGEPLVRVKPDFTFPVILEQYEFKATLQVPFSDYLLTMSSALAAASKSKRAAEYNAEAEKLQAALLAKQAFYEYARAVGQSIVAEQSYNELLARREDAKRAFEVGLQSKADYLRAEAAVEQGALAVTRTKIYTLATAENLRTLLHEPGETQYTIGENLLSPMPPFEGADNLANLQAEAYQKRLEIRALDDTVYALKEQAHVQRMANVPRIDGVANATMANPNQRYIPQRAQFDGTWDVSAVLTWSPTDMILNSAKARDTEAQASAIEERKNQLRDGIRIDVTRAWNSAREAQAAREASLKSLAAAAESYRVRSDLYRAGRSTLVELTDAQTALTRARVEVVDAQINERIARAALTRAIGRDAPQMKDR